MKPDILLTEPLVREIEATLDAEFEVHRAFDSEARLEVASRLGPRIQAIVTGGGTGASRRLVDLLPSLRIIAISGIGTDAVDLAHARERGIRVTTTPDILTADVADLAIALMLTTSRAICVGDRFVREGSWVNGESLALAHTMSSKSLGIVGLGRVGRAIAKRAAAFDMRIGYHDLHEMEDVSYSFFAGLKDLALWCDFFVIAAAGGSRSKGMVNAEVIDLVGPRGVLVNVSRGSVVDERALVDALLCGNLGAAGLDVFVDEPNVPSELLSLHNVVLQPHRASATYETRTAMGKLLLANLRAHFAGEPLKTPVA